jgi:signal transduction histidine kinase
MYYVVILLSLYLALRLALQVGLTEAVRIAPKSEAILSLYRDGQFAILNGVFLVFGIIGAVFTFIGGIFISHRAVGPLYRLRRLMREASEGRFPDSFKLRKNDYFEELFVELSGLLSRVERKKPDSGERPST